jgi:hypothetical protein
VDGQRYWTDMGVGVIHDIRQTSGIGISNGNEFSIRRSALYQELSE